MFRCSQTWPHDCHVLQHRNHSNPLASLSQSSHLPAPANLDAAHRNADISDSCLSADGSNNLASVPAGAFCLCQCYRHLPSSNTPQGRISARMASTSEWHAGQHCHSEHSSHEPELAPLHACPRAFGTAWHHAHQAAGLWLHQAGLEQGAACIMNGGAVSDCMANFPDQESENAFSCFLCASPD